MAEWITTAITGATSLFNSAVDMITGNAFMAVLLVGGTFVPLGFKLFKRARKTVA